ncbi:MAG TPA: cytidine deaminase [bacterium]|nr:cytidine deaminase [bacterium]
MAKTISKAQAKKLIAAAAKARKNAYAPYSKFKVGAAVLSKKGKVFGGCNVENASYGLTCCAERTAIFKAVSEGHNQLTAIAIVFDDKALGSPCGACRQVIREFGIGMQVVLANLKGGYKIMTIDELLPLSFGPESL